MTFHLGILVPVWQRRIVLRACLAHLSTLRARLVHYGIFTTVVCVRSPGDEAGEEAERTFQDFAWITTPNLPVGRKWNTGCRMFEQLDIDGLMILGSDNIVTAGYVAAAVHEMRRGADLVMPSALYFYDACEDEAFYTTASNIGAGNILSPTVLGRAGFAPWPANRNEGLDSQMRTKMYRHGAKDVRVIDLKCMAGTKAILDIKSQRTEVRTGERVRVSEGIHSFHEMFAAFKKKLTRVDPAEMFDFHFDRATRLILMREYA